MAFARREEKNTFCIPNLCGLNIAKDAILTGPEAEFLSVENRQNPREWKCRVFFSMQCSSALEVTIPNEVAQSSVSSLLAVDHQYWHQLLPLLVWKIKLSLLVAQEDRSYSSGSAVLVSFLFFFCVHMSTVFNIFAPMMLQHCSYVTGVKYRAVGT